MELTEQDTGEDDDFAGESAMRSELQAEGEEFVELQAEVEELREKVWLYEGREQGRMAALNLLQVSKEARNEQSTGQAAGSGSEVDRLPKAGNSRCNRFVGPSSPEACPSVGRHRIAHNLSYGMPALFLLGLLSSFLVMGVNGKPLESLHKELNFAVTVYKTAELVPDIGGSGWGPEGWGSGQGTILEVASGDGPLGNHLAAQTSPRSPGYSPGFIGNSCNHNYSVQEFQLKSAPLPLSPGTPPSLPVPLNSPTLSLSGIARGG